MLRRVFSAASDPDTYAAYTAAAASSPLEEVLLFELLSGRSLFVHPLFWQFGHTFDGPS